MRHFWSKHPRPELTVIKRFCHKDRCGGDEQRNRSKEDGLVAEHHGHKDKGDQGHEEADALQDPASREQTLLWSGLERPHSEGRRGQVPPQKNKEKGSICEKGHL